MGAAKIEQHTIDPIPVTERHGRARDLFTLWFGSNIMMLSILTGALATMLFKLPLLGALLAIATGNLVGGVFMALHGAQGPQLGLPQMVQCRGQFGSRGAIFVVAVVVIMNLGFFASNLVLGSQSLRTIAPATNDDLNIGLIALLSLAAAVYGYDWIHAFGRWMSWVGGFALLASFAWIMGVSRLPPDLWQRGTTSIAGFFGMTAAGALWQIAYAPYVSDYSRYMRVDSGVRPTFWASYGGSTLGSILPMALGALVGITVAEANVVTALAGRLGPVGIPVVAILSLGLGAASAMNIYCGVLSAITIGQTFVPVWRPRGQSRLILSVIFVAIALAIALLGARNFLSNYENFLTLLLCVMAPWTAINLVDFYLVRHGAYDVDSFFKANGGLYGRYNFVALSCYGFGILIQVPFLVTNLYTGPVAKMLGGVDISWLLGLFLVGPLYLLMARVAGKSDMESSNVT